jgi:RND family efflux transporter MFP subunit
MQTNFLYRMGVIAATVLLALAVTPCLSQTHAQEEGGDPSAQQGPPPQAVRVGDVRQEELQDRWLVIGRLQEVRRTRVAAEQEGQIVSVKAEEGDRVEGGKTVLARIDDVSAKLRLDVAQARVAEYEAEIKENQAALDRAERELEYLVQVQASGSARQKEVDDARADVDAVRARVAAATARVRTAQAEIARIEDDIKRLRVVAPFDGVVVKKETEVGQWAMPGSVIAEIVSLDPIDAVIDVPESMVKNLTVGAALHVSVESLGETVPGEVVAIVPTGTRSSRTFPVKVRLNNDDLKLKPGMSVRAMVPMTKLATVFTVPRDAVKRTQMGTIVWANLEGAAVPVPVEVLFGHMDRWAVKSIDGAKPSLFPGMAVITEGGVRVFPGQPLIVLPPDAPAPSASEPASDTDSKTSTGAA